MDDQVDSVYLAAAVLGEHQTKEVEPGVWQHTFTPPQTFVPPTTSSLKIFIPKIWSDLLMRKIQAEFRAIRHELIKEAHRSLRMQHRRTRRKLRAAFRRRKRGLA